MEESIRRTRCVRRRTGAGSAHPGSLPWLLEPQDSGTLGSSPYGNFGRRAAVKLVFIWLLAVGVAVRNSEVDDGWMAKVAVGRELAADKKNPNGRSIVFFQQTTTAGPRVGANFGPRLPTRAARIQPTTFLVSTPQTKKKG